MLLILVYPLPSFQKRRPAATLLSIYDYEWVEHVRQRAAKHDGGAEFLTFIYPISLSLVVLRYLDIKGLGTEGYMEP